MATDLRNRGIRAVPDGLDPELEDYLKDVHRLFRQVLDGNLGSTTVVAGGTGGTPGPAGPPGPAGAPAPGTTPDLTPPPTPSGLSATAGFANIFIQWTVATYTQGHANLQTNIYGAKYPGTGPLPTFGDAVLVGVAPQPDTIFVLPTELSTQWHIWIKFQSHDGVESVSPAGGANGAQATTGQIGTADLGPLIIEAGNLAAGAVTTAKFAAGIEPVAIVGALPSPSGYTGPKTVFLTTDGKLYRYVSGAWTAAIPAVDISGQVVGTQIADNSISTPKLQANSVVAGKIAAAAVSATEVAANAIQAVHLAANSIAVGTAAIQNGAIVNAMIANATIDDAKVANLSVSKLTAAALGVGSYIQSNDYVSTVSGWRISGNGFAELGAASIRGQLTASQINGNGLVIRDLSGVAILGVGNGLQASYLAAIIGGGNLLSNSSFEVDNDASGFADNWNVYGNGTTGAITGALLTGGVAGGKYQRITASNLGTSITDQAGVYSVVELTNLAGKAFVYSAWIKGLGGGLGGMNARLYIDFYDAAGGTGSVVGAKQSLITTPATSWTRYELKDTVPAGAVSALCYLWMESRGGAAGATQIDIDALQFEIGEVSTAYAPSARDKVGIDNKVTSANVSTYIASAAIGDAYISNLSASKITTGTMDAARITAGTITTDRIQVGAATAAASQLTSFTTATWTAQTTANQNNTLLNFTSTGSPVTFNAVVHVELGGDVTFFLNTSVDWVQIEVALHIDGVFKRSTIGYVKTVPTAAGKRFVSHEGSLLWREVLSAGPHTFEARTTAQFLSSTGAPQSTDGRISVSAVAVAQENKV